MSKKFRYVFAVCFVAVMALAALGDRAEAYDIESEMKRSKQEAAEASLPPPPKPRLAVQLFEDKSGSGAPGDAITDMMTTELISADLFTVVEREKIIMSTQEQDIAGSGLMNLDTAPEYGKLTGAEFAMTGAITEYRTDAVGGVIPIKGFGIAIGSNTATVMLDVRVVNNRTGEVVMAMRETGASNQTIGGLASRYGGFGGGKTGGIFAGATHKVVLKIIERLKNEGLRKMQAVSRGNLAAESAVSSANLLSVDAKFTTAAIDVGLNTGVRKGSLFAVYRAGSVIKDMSGNILGEEKTYIGIIQVTDAQQAYSNCKVIEGSGFKRGDKVQRINSLDEVVISQ